MQTTETVEQSLDVSLREIGQLEIGQRTAPLAVRSNLRTDFDAGGAAERRADRGDGEDGSTR